MEFLGAFINGLLSIVVYFIISLGVYKLYYIAKDIHEIKELMERGLRNSAEVAAPLRGTVPAVVPAAAPVLAKDLSAEESASIYAEQLLRAVNAESPSTAIETHEVR